MKRENGQFAKILLTWVKLVLTDEVAIVVHENTKLFGPKVIVPLFDEHYIWIPIDNVCPEHAGVYSMGRPRRVDIFLHKRKVHILSDIPKQFEWLSQKLQAITVGPQDLFFEEDQAELLYELSQSGAL